MTASPYTDSFYAQGREMALSSARVVLDLIAHGRDLNTVVDFGCGSNAWLDVAKELGASYCLGIDSTGTGPDIHADVTEPLDLDQRFDLAICLEVGEHFEEKYAQALVDNLVEASDYVLFSAAIPGQPGVNHVNCQWQSWWATLFEEEDYTVWPGIRMEIWADARVENFYRQNMFIATARPEMIPYECGLDARMPLDVVHPDRVTPGWEGR